MLKELLFDEVFKDVILNDVKQTTSRLTTTLTTNDTFLYEDVLFVVTSVRVEKIRDVDYVSESFNSTQELLDKLTEIYVTRLKRRVNITDEDEMCVITFQRVNITR